MATYKVALKVQSGPAKVKGAVLGGYLTTDPTGAARVELRTARLGDKSWTFAAGKVKDVGTWQLSGVTLSCAFDGTHGNAQVTATVTDRGLNAIRLTGKTTIAALGRAEIVATGRGVLVAATDPTPKPDPSLPVIRWQDRIRRQMLFVSAPNYFWPGMTSQERRLWLDAIAATGNVDGIDLELGGDEGALNYIRGVNPPANYDARERDLFPAFEPWLIGCRERGLIISLKFWNCNGNASGRDAAWWRNHAKTFAKRFGSDNLLVLAGNEFDKATSEDRRKALYQGFLDGGFPASQLIGYNDNDEYGIKCWFSESHPQKPGATDLKGSSFRHINATDSRPSISHLYDNWLKEDGIGGRLKPANVVDYVKRCRAKGTSCSLYSFRQKVDFEMLAVASKAWGGQNVSGDAISLSRVRWVSPNQIDIGKASITVQMKSAKIEGGNVRVDYSPPSSWWRSSSEATKFPRGLIAWQSGGETLVGHFDWFKPTQTVKTLGNVTNGYLKARPSVGQEVYFLIASNDGKERTNVVSGGKWK